MREFSPNYTAGETDLDQFISWGKDADIIDKSEPLFSHLGSASRTHVIFEVEADDADVVTYDPAWINGEVRRFCTSGCYSHFPKTSIIMALVPSKDATEALKPEIEILGRMNTPKELQSLF